ncbi:putative membrane protein [Virgibacillus halotolerans]|uniref:hypothetical protein n=1 Tax=Virgibacillus halotolerans TaxID=1071053 RepID=UPI001EF7F0CA|nr:hypothetical protein [Virgibacillus halotolerans]MBM7599561.1 putative membrane protein [Virgibacillus halotolerans]
MKLSMTSKRGLLTIHILFAAIMFGNMVTLLILSITAATTENAQLIKSCYQIMHVLASTSVKASTIGTTVTGILLSIWTKWGLFQFYWIIAKQIITIMLIGFNLWGIYAWTLQALSRVETITDQTNMFMLQIDLWIGITIQIISLIFIFTISVFKPWGRRKQQK